MGLEEEYRVFVLCDERQEEMSASWLEVKTG